MTGETPGAEWTPGFDGQRAPFTPGNDAALVHGARSEARIGPLAAQIADDLLTDPDVPQHVREPMFKAAVTAWARAEAILRLLTEWLDGQDLAGAMTAVTTAEEDETRARGKATRKSVTRSLPNVLDMLRKQESIALNLRARLGLDPASAARVGRDMAVARRLNAGATPLDKALDQIEANQLRALEGGAGG